MQTINFEFSLVGADVGKEEGVIKGVSIITSGVQAKGHDLEVDQTTLNQMLSCATKKGKVKVKWNHRTGADAINGNLRNFRLEDGKLKGDWHLLKSHPSYNHALELAAEMPEEVGLSASFGGLSELGDGTKIHEADEQTKHQYIIKGMERLPVPEGRRFARCSHLVSVDLVADPAANPGGLFEAKVDTPQKGMADNNNQDGGAANHEFTMGDVMAGIQALQQGFNQLAERTAQLEEFATDLSEAGQELEAHEQDDAGDGSDQQFGSMEQAVHYLETRLKQVGDEREQAESEHAFAVLEDRLNGLLQLNTQLTAENKVLAEAISEFTSHTGNVVEFSAGADGEGYQAHVTLASEAKLAPRTEFESRCRVLEGEGKSDTDAIMFAVKENPARYTKHLQAIGVMAHTL